MKIKRGSVTPVDLTGQATGDYIRNDAGVYKPRTTGLVTTDVVLQDQWMKIPQTLFDTTAVTGTGSLSTIRGRFNRLNTGATAGSTARRGTLFSDSAWSFGQIYTTIDWRKRIIIQFTSNVIDGSVCTANSQRWFYFGCKEDDAIAEPTKAGIGIRADRNAIFGQCHDGTTLTSVDLSSNYSGGALVLITIVSNRGAVEWFVNGVSKGTSTGGPNVLGNLSDASIRASITNGTDAAENVYVLLGTVNVYVEQ